MELAADAATLGDLPRSLTRRDTLIVETHARTNNIPRLFQLEFALAVDSGRDVLCVAGAGSGESLAFAMIHFLRDNIQTWIVSPPNVVEHQMAEDYRSYGLHAVAVNAPTLTPQLIRVSFSAYICSLLTVGRRRSRKINAIL